MKRPMIIALALFLGSQNLVAQELEQAPAKTEAEGAAKAKAEKLWVDANEAALAGKHTQATTLGWRVYTLYPATDLLIDLADWEDRAGRPEIALRARLMFLAKNRHGDPAVFTKVQASAINSLQQQSAEERARFLGASCRFFQTSRLPPQVQRVLGPQACTTWLRLSLAPAIPLRILIDGKVIGEGTPETTNPHQLTRGPHKLRVEPLEKTGAYLPYEQNIVVTPDMQTLQIQLTPRALLTILPQGATRILVDGREIPIPKGKEGVEVPVAPGEYEVQSIGMLGRKRWEQVAVADGQRVTQGMRPPRLLASGLLFAATGVGIAAGIVLGVCHGKDLSCREDQDNQQNRHLSLLGRMGGAFTLSVVTLTLGIATFPINTPPSGRARSAP